MSRVDRMGTPPDRAGAVVQGYGFQVREVNAGLPQPMMSTWGRDILAGSLLDQWSQREWVIECLARTLVDLVAALEREDFVVVEATNTVTPDHSPRISLHHGLVGIDYGLIESRLTLRLIEFSRLGWQENEA